MKFAFRNLARIAFSAVALVAITACRGGGDTPTTPPPPPPAPAAYSIGGTVSGLDAGQSVVLQDNGRDDVTVSANSAFTFDSKVTSGGSYSVTSSAPAGKTCTVTGGVGTVSADVSSVVVACAGPYTVGGIVSGLVGQGLELQLDGSLLGISRNGPYMFPPLNPGPNGHGVGILRQPDSPAQRCVVQNSYFTVTSTNAADISNVNILCGEFSYIANSGADTISAYLIDASTGAITSVSSPVTTGMSPYAMASTIDKKYLYVGNGGSNDISAFAVDASSGALTTVAGSPFASGTSPRAVSRFSATSCTFRGGHCHVDSYLYVANAGSDSVSAYAADQNTGVLKSLSPASYAKGAGPSAMAIHPTAGFLYTANTGGSDDISAFRMDFTNGSLTPIAGSPFPSGSSVSSLAFGGSVNTYPLFLYAANASGGTAAIYGFSITGTGGLTSVAGFPYSLPSCPFIVADQTHTYLYATAGTNVFGVSMDQQTGALSPLSGFPVAIGVNATSLSIDATNQYLYVANGSAGTVAGFNLNAATGELTAMPGSPFTVGTSADYIATF